MGIQYRGILHVELKIPDEALIKKVQDALFETHGIDELFYDPDKYPAYLGHYALELNIDTQFSGANPLGHLIQSVASADPDNITAVMWIDCESFDGRYMFVYSNETTLTQATQMRTGFLERVKEGVRRIEATLPFAEGADPVFQEVGKAFSVESVIHF